jgi:hypothetical protein
MWCDIESIHKIIHEVIEKLSHIPYGEASIILRTHEGNLASVTQSLTENNRCKIQLSGGLESVDNKGDKA